jgi:hypothetical protein
LGAAGGRKRAPTVAHRHEEPELNTAPARPQLVVVSESTGSVPKALTEILKPVPGMRVEMLTPTKDMQHDVGKWASSLASTVQFAEVVRKTGIKTRMVKDLVYLLNVQLVPTMSQASADTR